MQAKVIQIKRSKITEEHATDPEQTGLETKLEVRINLFDMPAVPVSDMHEPSKTWVPDSAYLTESYVTGYGDNEVVHYRVVEASGFLVRKDGTVGKIAYDCTWRSYSSAKVFGSLGTMPAALQEALAQVIPAFKKGTLPA